MPSGIHARAAKAREVSTPVVAADGRPGTAAPGGGGHEQGIGDEVDADADHPARQPAEHVVDRRREIPVAALPPSLAEFPERDRSMSTSGDLRLKAAPAAVATSLLTRSGRPYRLALLICGRPECR